MSWEQKVLDDDKCPADLEEIRRIRRTIFTLVELGLIRPDKDRILYPTEEALQSLHAWVRTLDDKFPSDRVDKLLFKGAVMTIAEMKKDVDEEDLDDLATFLYNIAREYLLLFKFREEEDKVSWPSPGLN